LYVLPAWAACGIGGRLLGLPPAAPPPPLPPYTFPGNQRARGLFEGRGVTPDALGGGPPDGEGGPRHLYGGPPGRTRAVGRGGDRDDPGRRGGAAHDDLTPVARTRQASARGRLCRASPDRHVPPALADPGVHRRLDPAARRRERRRVRGRHPVGVPRRDRAL